MKLLQKLKRRTPLGWLQLSHEKSRLLVALSGIAFADILIFMQLGFQNALYNSNTRLHRSLQTDVVLMSTQARNLVNLSTFPRRRIYQAMDIPGVETAEAMYINFVDWKNPQNREDKTVLVLGINPNRSVFDFPEVNQNLDKIKLADTVLFDRASRGEYAEAIAKVEQGQTVTSEIERRTVTIAGLYQVGTSFAYDGSIITSDQNFLRFFPKRQNGTVSLGLVKVQPGYDPEEVVANLNTYLPEDVKALTIEGFVEFEKTYWAQNTAIGFVFSLGTVMGFIVGVVIVYQVLATDVNDHMAEYATFKAMGYRNLYLLGVVFEEAVILALLGFVPGVSVCLGLYRMTRNATNLPIYMSLVRIIQVLILTIVMCCISGAIATRKLQSADPADIF